MTHLQPDCHWANFDYGLLDVAQTEKALDQIGEINQGGKSIVESLVEIGAKLKAALIDFGVGVGGKWIRSETGWGCREYRHFIRLSEYFSQGVPFFMDAPAALYLTQPNIPERAIEKLLEEAAEGVRVTLHSAKQRVRELKAEDKAARRKAKQELMAKLQEEAELNVLDQPGDMDREGAPAIANVDPDVLPGGHVDREEEEQDGAIEVKTDELVIGVVSNADRLNEAQIELVQTRLWDDQQRRQKKIKLKAVSEEWLSRGMVEKSDAIATVEQLISYFNLAGYFGQTADTHPIVMKPLPPAVPQPSTKRLPIPGFDTLVAFFNNAAAKIKSPEVQIKLNGHTLCLRRNSTDPNEYNGKHPGAINLKDWGGIWHGRISPDGKLYKGREYQDGSVAKTC